MGCDADDWLEAAKKTSQQFAGAKHALREHAKKVQQNVLKVKRELEEGKLEGMEAVKIADYAVLQIQRAVDSLNIASQHFENKQQSAAGEIAAYTFMVSHVAGLQKKEVDRLQKIVEAIESGDVVMDEAGGLSQSEAGNNSGNGRIPGVRPGMSISAQRKAEAAAEKAAANGAGQGEADADGSEQVEGAPVKTEAVADEPEPKKKRKYKKRKKKTTAPEVDAAPDGQDT